MRKYTFTDGGYTFQRIDKKAARRAYNNGLRVMLCPVNLRPGYPYHPETSISGKAAATFEGRKPGVIRRFISRFERLTDSQGKHPRRQRWERSRSTIIDI